MVEGDRGRSTRAGAFVGRDDDLAALREALRTGGTTRIVRGPAGIGKSRLVRELSAWAAGQGATVLLGRGSAAAQPTPLRPISEALLGAARRGVRLDDELAPFAPALASLVPDWGDGAAPDSPLLLAEAVLRLLVTLGDDVAATLVVEDLQWADPETLAVVEYLADNLEGSPVLLVATVRDGEPGQGASLAASLVERRVASEVVLGPLAGDAVVEVARSCVTGGEVPAEVTRALAERSEGVPFLVEELVATAVAAGWDTVAAAVPGSVVASVERRLEHLSPEARRLLLAAALLGRFFDWSVAARAAGLPEEAAADLLRDAVRAQLVEVEASGFRFRHTLSRDAVVAAAAPADIDLLGARLLDELDPPVNDGTDDGTASDTISAERALLAAELATQAGQSDRAARLLLRAANDALDSGALASADAFASRARDVATPASADDVDEVLLRVRVLAGRTEDARRLGEHLLVQRRDPIARADVHAALAAAELAAGRWDDARTHAEAVAGLAPGDVARIARADALAAQAAMGRDDVEEATSRAKAALAGARASGQAHVECEALEVIGRVERGRDLAAAEAAFQEAFDVATSNSLPLWRVRALQELGTIDMFGSLELDRLLEARREAEALGALATVAVVDLQLAALHDERGELADALTAAERCTEVSRRLRLSTLAMSFGVQAMVHARLGDRARMDDALAQGFATGEDADYLEAAKWGNVVPIYHLVVGDLEAAAEGLDHGMALIRRRPAAAFPYPGLWALVRTLLDPTGAGAAARAEVAALTFDTPLSRWTLVAADAVAAGAAGDPAGAAARFAEADNGLSPHDGGFRQPLVRLLVAPAARRDGWGDPVAWLRASLARFEHLGLDVLAGRCRSELRAAGAAVPRRTRADSVDAVPPGLAGLGVTAREVDVLVLVAGGATNREVASRLFISPRTVDKHVERLLQKTGTTRGGLATVARDAGLLRT